MRRYIYIILLLFLASCDDNTCENLPCDESNVDTKELNIESVKINTLGTLSINNRNYLISQYTINSNRYYHSVEISDISISAYSKYSLKRKYKMENLEFLVFTCNEDNKPTLYIAKNIDTTVTNINDVLILN